VVLRTLIIGPSRCSGIEQIGKKETVPLYETSFHQVTRPLRDTLLGVRCVRHLDSLPRHLMGSALASGQTSWVARKGAPFVATFVLVHGSYFGNFSWRWVAPCLRAAGHDVHTPGLTKAERLQNDDVSVTMEQTYKGDVKRPRHEPCRSPHSSVRLTRYISHVLSFLA
jgi:hypothetical protein